MTEKFLIALMKHVNTLMNVYYEEAPKSATYPFGVVPTLSITSLDYGYQCIFDVELYVNELSESSIEKLCDNLRIGLDNYSYNDDIIGFHVNFENQYLTKQNEQDLIYRRITFVARIF